MSITSSLINRRKPRSLGPYGDTRTGWQRPVTWPVHTDPASGAITALIAVWESDYNPVSLLCVTSTGQYQVDWGDGSSPTNHNSNTKAENNISWSGVSSDTLQPEGYRIAKITITPVSGNITTFNIKQYHTLLQVGGRSEGWLEIKLNAANLNALVIGSTSSAPLHGFLENVEVLSSSLSSLYYSFYLEYNLRRVLINSSSALTDARNAFANCNMLTDVIINATVGNGCDGGAMFQNCYSLRRGVDFKFGSTGRFWTYQNFYNGCSSLEWCPSYRYNDTTNFTGMFQNCGNLRWVGDINNTGSAPNFTSMFQNCYNLDYPPYINFQTGGSINTSNMFNSSGIRKMNPRWNITAISTSTSMFANCRNLESIPVAGVDIVSFFGSGNSIFQNCIKLKKIPTGAFPSNNLTISSNMFNGCCGIREIGALSLAAGTIDTNSFSGCSISKHELVQIGFSGVGNLTWTLSNQLMSTTYLNNLMIALAGGTNTSGTLIINGNPGVDTAVTKTSSVSTTGSTTITVPDVTNLSVGMVMSMAGVSAETTNTRAVTFQDTANTVTLTAHGLPAGKRIAFTSITSTTGIAVRTYYYVVNPTADTFQVATTVGGAAINLVTDGSGNLTYMPQVTAVGTTTVTVDVPAYSGGTTSAVFRKLNVWLGQSKNWTITV